MEGTKYMSFSRRTFGLRVVPTLVIFSLLVALVGACGSQDNYNDYAKQQYAQEAQLKTQELAPATGDWCGSMHLTNAGLDTNVKISLKVLPTSVQAPSSQDPNLIAQQLKLQGAMVFPILSGATSAVFDSLPDLAQATGGADMVSLTNGDYYPQNEPQITLPFSVPTSPQSVYGVVEGDLVNGHFVGSWSSNSNQDVGKFDLQKCATGDAS